MNTQTIMIMLGVGAGSLLLLSGKRSKSKPAILEPQQLSGSPLDFPDWERLSTLHAIHPDAYPHFVELLQYAEELGYKLKIGSAVRTCEEQRLLNEKGWTKAKCSWHLGGRAIDIMLNDSIPWIPEYDELGEWWKAKGGSHGGSYPGYGEHGDYAHFQWTPPPLKTAADIICIDDADCEGQYNNYWLEVSREYQGL